MNQVFTTPKSFFRLTLLGLKLGTEYYFESMGLNAFVIILQQSDPGSPTQLKPYRPHQEAKMRSINWYGYSYLKKLTISKGKVLKVIKADPFKILPFHFKVIFVLIILS